MSARYHQWEAEEDSRLKHAIVKFRRNTGKKKNGDYKPFRWGIIAKEVKISADACKAHWRMIKKEYHSEENYFEHMEGIDYKTNYADYQAFLRLLPNHGPINFIYRH